jgi:hypothetical protein
MPDVSEVTLLVPHPLCEEIAESGSVTVQLTDTSLVYQPFIPRVPVTFGVMTGGVESGGAVTFTVNVSGLFVAPGCPRPPLA